MGQIIMQNTTFFACKCPIGIIVTIITIIIVVITPHLFSYQPFPLHAWSRSSNTKCKALRTIPSTELSIQKVLPMIIIISKQHCLLYLLVHTWDRSRDAFFSFFFFKEEFLWIKKKKHFSFASGWNKVVSFSCSC